MNLYSVPRNSWILTKETGEQFFFHHVDGMYSLCENHNKDVVHLPAWTDVEILDKPVGN